MLSNRDLGNRILAEGYRQFHGTIIPLSACRISTRCVGFLPAAFHGSCFCCCRAFRGRWCRRRCRTAASAAGTEDKRRCQQDCCHFLHFSALFSVFCRFFPFSFSVFFSVSFYLLYREAQTFTQGFSGSIKSLSGENNESIKQ